MKKILVALTILVSTLIPVAVGATPVKVSGNAGKTYLWTNPYAVYDGTDTWFSAVSNAGNFRVFKNSSSVYTTLETNASYDDDHNAPGLAIQTGKKSLAFTSRHGADSNVKQYEIVDNGSTISNNFEKNVAFSDIVSYTRALTYGDTIVLLTRISSGSWAYRVSTDRGGTWGAEQSFFNPGTTAYLMFQESTTTGVFHFTATPNGSTTNYPFLNYGTLDLNSGNVQTLVSGSMTTIDNIYSPTGLPLDDTDLYDIQPTQSSNQKSRVLDVKEVDGKVVILFCKDGGGVNAGYYKAVLDSGVFTRSTFDDSASSPILSGGIWPGSPSGSLYVGGMTFNRNGNDTVTLSLKANDGTWKIKQYTLNSDMTTTYLGTIDSNTNPLVRPFSVHGSDQILYEELRAYTNFHDYTIWYWLE